MKLSTKYANRKKNLDNDTSVTMVCKECNKMFTTTVGLMCWHYDVGNIIPMYCEDCRQKKKEQRIQRQTEKNVETNSATETTEVIPENAENKN